MILKSSIIVVIIGILSTSSFAFQNQKPDTTETLYQLVTMAENVLSGKNPKSMLDYITQGACAVSSTHTADLHALLNGEDNSVKLSEDSTRHATGMQLKTNKIEDTAVLVLTTSSAPGKDLRYHTVIFMKEKGKWLIELWRTAD